MKPVNSSPFKILIGILLAVFFLNSCTAKESFIAEQAVDTPCISTGWPHDNSDLKPDPALLFGILENGMRYVVMHNEEPKDRVGLYLNIQVGSLEEQNSQRGYAHFLEHMLFNGTTHYPPGKLVKYFQSIGMGFGSDTNAHTTFNETVYRLLLPDDSEEHLNDGLQVMADYARGALLLPEEVERERGIILAEKRARDSAGYRLYEKRTRFVFSGTRVTERFPIGVEEIITKADAAKLRSFYNSWYRPENMILVVVGDVDKQLVEKKIKERFVALSSSSPLPDCYDFGRLNEAGERFLYVPEPELGKTELTIGTNWNILPEIDTAAREKKDLQKYIVAMLFQNRLQQLVRKHGSPLTKANSYSGDFLGRIGYATLVATVDGERWQEGLDLLGRSLRQAVEYGFSQKELARAKKEFLADIEKEVQTADSRDSRKLASDIIASLNDNRVFMSPKQELQLYGPLLDNLTTDDVNRVLKDIWTHPGRQVIVAGTAVIGGGGPPEDIVRLIYEKSLKETLPPWQEMEAAAFPYLPSPVTIPPSPEKEHFAEIGMDRFVFANGTVLQIKKTSFQPNEVLIEVHFGGGKRTESDAGLSMLAKAVVNESGVGALSRNELEEALAGHNVNVSFRIGEESFSLRGRGLSSEFELLLQLVWTRLVDPAFRDDAYHLSMDRFSQMYEQMTSSVEGMMQIEGERFLAGNNPRYGLPPADQFKQLTLEKVRKWLAPVFAGAPLEISVVGDVEPAAVVGLVGKYFGTRTRNYRQAPFGERVVFPSGRILRKNVVSRVDKAFVTVAWPTADFWDISRTRRLNILSQVFGDRLRVEIREKLGAVYSPQVYNQSSRVEPGYGVLRATITVDPDMAEDLAAKVQKVAADLAGGGVTEKELARSLEPSLTSIKDMMETNRYWMESVLTLSSRHPMQLLWPLTIQKDFASITAEEISNFARRYLRSDQSAEMIFMPVSQ